MTADVGLFCRPDAAVVRDVHNRPIETWSADLVEGGRRLQGGSKVEAVDADVRHVQRVERSSVLAVRGAVPALTVVQPPKRPFDPLVRVVKKRVRAAGGARV